jgi:hypothetical protein
VIELLILLTKKPAPYIIPPTKITHLGPNKSLILPPDIMVIGPTALQIMKTIARLPGSVPRCFAIGAAKTLHAYKDPIHKLIKQLANNTTHLLL